MKNEELKQQLIKLVAQTVRIDESKITEQSHFIDDLHLDSLDLVELIMEMEKHFGIEIAEKDAEHLRSINNVITYLEEKSAQK